MATKERSCAASKLDTIMESLQLLNSSKTVLLMVTPSKKSHHRYHVNIFGQGSVAHLGSTTITTAELLHLKSNGRQGNVSVMLAHKCVSLSQMLLNRKVIKKLMKMLNGKYCSDKRWKTDIFKTFERLEKYRRQVNLIELQKLCRKQKIHIQERQPQDTEAQMQLEAWNKELKQLREEQKKEKRRMKKLLKHLEKRVQKEIKKKKKRVRVYRIIEKPESNSQIPDVQQPAATPVPCSQETTAEDERPMIPKTRQEKDPAQSLLQPSTTIEHESQSSDVFQTAETSLNNLDVGSLMERINSTNTPNKADLTCFFDYAERHKFTIYIRPELVDQAQGQKLFARSGKEAEMDATFRLECFKPSNIYMGYITLNFETLKKQILKHLNLLPRMEVVDDALDIMPFPQTALLVLRIVSSLLGLEEYYDQFGQVLFDVYTRSC